MTRAILNEDRISMLTVDPDKGVEVGYLPKGVGFERLRWNGSEMIDLYYLDEFYVSRNDLKIYIRPSKNRDLVKMQYKDRSKLIYDTTTHKVRLKTRTEIDQPKKDEYKAKRRKEYPDTGDQLGAIMNYLKTQKDLTPELEQLIYSIDNVKDKWPTPEGI